MYLYTKKRPAGQAPRTGDPTIYQSVKDYEKEIETLKKEQPGVATYNIRRTDGTPVYQVPGAHQVAYWRKANAVHRFFVDHTADGKDECNPSFVHPEVLMDLLVRCKTILDTQDPQERQSAAQRLLPVQGGFFFGSTDYNQWYYEDLQDTVKQLTTVISEMPTDADLIYQASW